MGFGRPKSQNLEKVLYRYIFYKHFKIAHFDHFQTKNRAYSFNPMEFVEMDGRFVFSSSKRSRNTLSNFEKIIFRMTEIFTSIFLESWQNAYRGSWKWPFPKLPPCNKTLIGTSWPIVTLVPKKKFFFMVICMPTFDRKRDFRILSCSYMHEKNFFSKNFCWVGKGI